MVKKSLTCPHLHEKTGEPSQSSSFYWINCITETTRLEKASLNLTYIITVFNNWQDKEKPDFILCLILGTMLFCFIHSPLSNKQKRDQNEDKAGSVEPASYFSWKDRIESIQLLLGAIETPLSLSFHYFESGLTLTIIFPPTFLPGGFSAGQLHSEAFVLLLRLEGEERRGVRSNWSNGSEQ